jgi:hypothetical protein
VVCGEHGIGGDGEYCGGNDAQLDRTKVLYHTKLRAASACSERLSSTSSPV